MIKVKLDADEVMRQYSAALRRLAALTGFSPRQVLLSEAGVILKTWAGRTKVTTEAKADARSRVALGRKLGTNSASTRGDVTINAGVKKSKIVGTVWWRTSNKAGKKFLAIGQINKQGTSVRWRNFNGKTFEKYTRPITAVLNWIDNLPRYIARGRAAMGIARQSVVQIADELGIDLTQVQGGGSISVEGINKAKAAIAASGKRYKNGSGRQYIEKSKDVIDLFNRLPYARKIGMDRELLYIISGRAKFFEQSYAHGAFDSMKRTAKAYPWMTVQSAA